MARLKQGEPFEDLALRFSDGPNASQGGHLGLVRQGELLPGIERAIATLVPGGISDMIETSEGFHIVRLEDKKPKQFRPYEEVRNEIQRTRLSAEKRRCLPIVVGGISRTRPTSRSSLNPLFQDRPQSLPPLARHRRVRNNCVALDQSQPFLQPTKRTDTLAHF